MNIARLHKFTLIDYPRTLACTIFLQGCNFRCHYCHNPELVVPFQDDTYLKEEEVLLFLTERKKYLDGVCITGGETLINIELLSFLKKIKELGYKIKLDTNGSNPLLLQEIISKQLIDYVAIDIKYDKENYDKITGISVGVSNIEKSIKIVAESGLDYEFRTTVIPTYHTLEKIKDISIWVHDLINKKATTYALQNFVAKKNGLLDTKFENIRSFSKEELEQMREAVSDNFETVIIRN